MNIFDTIAQFKNVRPDPQNAERSKRAILAMPQTAAAPRRTGVMVFLRSLETGIALVLAGFFILLATGSFPSVKDLAPVQYSVIDPVGIHAEAQAIDIQIQLADLNYTEVNAIADSTTSVAAGNAAAAISRAIMNLGAATSSAAVPGAAASSSSPSSTAVSVDQALQILSQ